MAAAAAANAAALSVAGIASAPNAAREDKQGCFVASSAGSKSAVAKCTKSNHKLLTGR